jgi:chaperonin GroEL
LADLLELLEYATDKESEAFLRERIGKILGGVAILRIGDALPTRMDSRIAIAKETAKSMRRAIRDGILPGGGVALLACRDALESAQYPTGDSDARAAKRIMRQALRQPIRALCHNAGYDSAKLAELQGTPGGYGIDVRSGAIVDVIEAGIVDVASVLESALRGAVTSAALALTIDVLLHHKTPEQSYTP